MANPKLTKRDKELSIMETDGIIITKKRKTRHKPFVLTISYPDYGDGLFVAKSYIRHYKFAKLKGALDSYNSTIAGWRSLYDRYANATYTLINNNTNEDLTHLLKR